MVYQLNYEQEEIKINMMWANIIALVFLVVSFIVFGFVFLIINDKNTSFKIFELSKLLFIWKNNNSYIFFILITILGLLVHEFIHGVTWSFFTQKGFYSIKFGIHWKTFTPYCSCKETLNKNNYQLGAIMPFIILGFIPLIISIFFGSKILFLFSIVFINIAVGDIIAFIKLFNEKSDSLISDHPTAVGWYIYRKNSKK